MRYTFLQIVYKYSVRLQHLYIYMLNHLMTTKMFHNSMTWRQFVQRGGDGKEWSCFSPETLDFSTHYVFEVHAGVIGEVRIFNKRVLNMQK